VPIRQGEVVGDLAELVVGDTAAAARIEGSYV
jgi:hypothetical protein